ncbi:hypothetical protein [Couchioplanes caeruleus]|uniref:Uncharacterized protein n=2 Tax=Couchioplanes caeruleus TaxID=56438 RepID=A0A1K0FZ25_9ACTN|nr:hypothetical protein [Couchioplanes caeruleus]OJF10314.1 hypothetical protein BG844_32580 [Couchioplanes caeruleus subsp. caeruleus]ROP30037.1 hypothetical protein EDD30_2868 [Couchioplanes caeruleus]
MTTPAPGGSTSAAPDGDQFARGTMGSFRAAKELLSQAVDKIRKEWDAMVARINALLERLEHELNNDSVWATISEWWTEKIKDAVEKVHSLIKVIGQQVSEVLASVDKVVAGSVPVLSLFEVGLDWAVKVNTPLSDLGPDMTGSGAIDAWRGPAKETYEKRVRDQIDAVEAATGKVKTVGNWLAEVAAANTAYMVSLADRAADVVGALVAVIIDATETASGAVTQIVITLQHTSELIGEIVKQTLQYLANLANRMAEVVKQITAVAGEYGDHTGLPGGKWPTPVNA